MSQAESPSPYGTNSAAMAALALVQRLTGAISTVVLAHLLGPALLGAYSIAAATANGAYGVFRLGLDMGVHVLAAREQSERSPQRLGEILGLGIAAMTALTIAGALICLLLAKPIGAALFGDPRAATFVGIGGLLLLGQGLSQSAYVSYAGLHRFGGYVRVMLVGSVLLALGVIAGAMFGAATAALASATGQLLIAAALLVVVWRTAAGLGVAMRPNLRWPMLREILRVGLPFYAAGLLLAPVEYLAQASLARAHGLASLGDLRVVTTVATVVTLLPAAANGPMISAMSRLHAAGGDPAEAISANLRAMWSVSLAAALVVGLLWPLGVDVLFGPTYRAARDLGVLGVVAAFGLCLRHVLSNSLLAFGRQRLLLLVGALEAGAFALTAYALIGRLGLGGYLLAQAAGMLAPLAAAWMWGAAAGLRPLRDGRILGATGLSIVGLAAVVGTNLAPAASAMTWAAASVAVAAVASSWPWLVFSSSERRAAVQAGARLARRCRFFDRQT